ncbi:hypothetical protein GWI33_002747 [Rhynchophorus ferrugineus]|uniref:FLYWCH-type domain-containing protein n=1 Tax=Rhynchophorus ferrugineus TaxID=354439 RepID=A0A834IK17_RHYFE|nr:hypothetical protein GWI33_002747 [Rhynchophorus ferrugineus]
MKELLKTRWRCTQERRTKCPAALYTSDGIIYIVGGRKHPRLMLNDYEYSVHVQEHFRTRWRCTNRRNNCSAVIYTTGNRVECSKCTNINLVCLSENLCYLYIERTKCKSVIYSTLQDNTIIKQLYRHNHEDNADKWDVRKMIAKRFRVIQYYTKSAKHTRKQSTPRSKKNSGRQEIDIHVEGHSEPIKLKVMSDDIIE